MGVLADKHKYVYPVANKSVAKEKHDFKERDSYMEQLTRSFLSNFRAFIETANQS